LPWRTSRKTANDTIVKLMALVTNSPTLPVTTPADWAASSAGYGPPGVPDCQDEEEVREEEVRKVYIPRQQSQRRAQHVLPPRLHHPVEGRPDDDSYGHVDHVSSQRKGFVLLEHERWLSCGSGDERCGS
jgi:hypothetical protein